MLLFFFFKEGNFAVPVLTKNMVALVGRKEYLKKNAVNSPSLYVLASFGGSADQDETKIPT